MAQPSVYYGETPSGDPLAPWVAAYWHFRADPRGAEFEHTIPPDGSLSLFVGVGPGREPGLGLTGPRTEPLTVRIHEPVRYWGVRFWPGAAVALLPLGGDPRRDEEAQPGAGVLGEWGERAAAALAGARDEDDAARRWDGVLGKRLRRARPLDPEVQAAVVAIIAAGGQVRIGKLAGELGLSPRQLRRRFRARTGLSPKELARVRRIRATIAPLAVGSPEPWAAAAAGGGFADQAHLVHEVRRLFGRPPAEVLAYLRGIEHGRVIDR